MISKLVDTFIDMSVCRKLNTAVFVADVNVVEGEKYKHYRLDIPLKGYKDVVVGTGRSTFGYTVQTIIWAADENGNITPNYNMAQMLAAPYMNKRDHRSALRKAGYKIV